VRPDRDVAGIEIGADVPDGVGVVPVVVGHHGLDRDSVGGEELGSSGREPCCGVAFLVAVDP
jgi:hypothetical protein